MLTGGLPWYRRLLSKIFGIFSIDASPECAACKQLLFESESDRKLADLLESKFGKCGCEKFSVGDGSPGRVQNYEPLHRIIASPRDYDPETGTILARPFEKVFSNGLSVWRGKGPDGDIRILLGEALIRSQADPARRIFAICEVYAGDVRRKFDNSRARAFCVYDQTVTRMDDPSSSPIPTHAGIFLRIPAPNTADRKKIQKDYAGWLREKFIEGRVEIANYRNGVCFELNQRAAAGEFDRP
jgi:hypothetical protein